MIKYTGSDDTKLQQRTKIDALKLLKTLIKGSKLKLWNMSGLNWREKHPNSSHIRIPKPMHFELKEIKIHTNVMFDAFAKLAGNGYKGIYRIRFTAQKEAYVTSPDATFFFDPRSIKHIE